MAVVTFRLQDEETGQDVTVVTKIDYANAPNVIEAIADAMLAATFLPESIKVAMREWLDE